MANEIQRAMNILGSSLGGGVLALAKGLSKGKKPSADKAEQKSETEVVLSSLGFTTDLSSEEATQRAFAAANNAIMEKLRAKNLRDAKTGKFVKRNVSETSKTKSKFTAGGKE